MAKKINKYYMNTREKEILDKASDLLVRELQPQRIYLFGSRAKEKTRHGSDFDFALDCKPPERNHVRQIKEMLDAIGGLYSIDIVFLTEVDAGFKAIILDTGKIIYEKK